MRERPDTSRNENAELVSPDKPLTDRQREFVKLWAAGESINSAQAKAGYSGTIGYRLIRMPNILAHYHKEKERYEIAAQMTREKAMGMLLEAYDIAKLQAEPMAMVAATREVIKMCGYSAPIERRITLELTGNAQLDKMNTLSNAELAKIVGEAPEEFKQELETAVHDVMSDDDDQDNQ